MNSNNFFETQGPAQKQPPLITQLGLPGRLYSQLPETRLNAQSQNQQTLPNLILGAFQLASWCNWVGPAFDFTTGIGHTIQDGGKVPQGICVFPEVADEAVKILQQHGITLRDQEGTGILGFPQYVMDLSEAPWEPGGWFGNMLQDGGYTANISVRGKDYDRAAELLVKKGFSFPGNPTIASEAQSS